MADSDVAVSVGDQLPMLLKNSAYTVDANLQKHTRAPPRTRSGRFQSMLSVRRATPLLVRRLIMVDISIHALRKESDQAADHVGHQLHISIHALRKESDRAAGHFCPLSETQASCLALSISNNTTGTTNNMPKTSSCLSVSF